MSPPPAPRDRSFGVEGRDGHMFHRQWVQRRDYASPWSAAGKDSIPPGGFETRYERRAAKSAAQDKFRPLPFGSFED